MIALIKRGGRFENRRFFMIEDQLLELLRSNSDEFLSGNEMSMKLGISRTGVWKHIEHLRKLGYEIEAQPHLGYRLVSTPDRLIPEEIGWRLGTEWMGKKILSYEETSSTNDIAWKLAMQGVSEGTVVFAEFQSKGKGRLGRTWVAPKGKSILTSVILRPRLLPNQASQMTMMSAVAVAQAIEIQTGLSPQIKWPNDILIEGKKVAGILTEMQAETDQIRFLVVGIGINVTIPREYLLENADSIHLHLSSSTMLRISLAQELLRQLEKGCDLLHQGGWDRIKEEWERRSFLTGRYIQVRCLEHRMEGIVTGLDPDGSLLVRLGHGFTERVMAGDVVSVR